MSERFLITGSTLPLQRWQAQEMCRDNGPASEICGMVAQRTQYQGDLRPIEWDATLVWRYLKAARSSDPVESAVAAWNISRFIDAHSAEIVGFMGLFPDEISDEIFSMPARASLAKRIAFEQWRKSGVMPELVKRLAVSDPGVIREMEAAGAPVLAQGGSVRVEVNTTGLLVTGLALMALATWWRGRK